MSGALNKGALIKELLFLCLFIVCISLVPANAAGLLANCDNLSSSACFPKYKKDFVYRIDLGDFGDMSSTEVEDIVKESLDIWNSVATTSMNFHQDSPSHLDSNVATGDEFMAIFESKEKIGYSHIILDQNSRMTEELLGAGSRLFVIGIAGARLINPQSKEIVESISMFNDYFFDSTKQNKPKEELITNFKAVILHESGHMIGLDHTQTHRDALNGVGSQSVPNTPTNFKSHVPILFPFAVNDTFNLQNDDIASISQAYPAGDFDRRFGVIKGRALDWDGKPLLGVNITAYKVSDPFNKAVSSVSDVHGKNNGEFEIQGLEPGAYVLRLERIDPDFKGGSSVGPHSPNLSPAVTEGYYIGEDSPLVTLFAEAALRGVVDVSAASTVSGITIKMFDHGNSINDPATVVFDHSQNEIYELPAAIQASSDQDVFKVVVKETSSISFTSTGSTSLSARLLDARGIEIANDLEDEVFKNFSIYETLFPGEYFLEIKGAFDSALGVYNVRSAIDDHGNSIAEASKVDVISGEAHSEALFLPSNKDIDFFELSVKSGGVMAIETIGNLDTIGTLYDSSGRKIERSESGGDDFNFLISRFINAGTYYLSVETKNSYGDIFLKLNLSPSNSSGGATFSDATGTNAEENVVLKKKNNKVKLAMKKINNGRSRKLKLKFSVPQQYKKLIRLPKKRTKKISKKKDAFTIKLRLAKSKKFEKRFPGAQELEIPVTMRDTATGYELVKTLKIKI